MKREAIFFIILSILLISFVFAHQPRLVYEKESDMDSPFVVQNPEISQAFYGDLKGQPDYYSINSDVPFRLYINILSPVIKDAKKDFSVRVFKDNRIIANLSASESNWEKFHEEFANDDYYRGPEFQMNVTEGNYIIQVANPSNLGKYSLAIGQIESFPLKESVNTIILLPKLKTFFDKSPFVAYFNTIGLFILSSVIIFFIFIVLIVFIVKMLKRMK